MKTETEILVGCYRDWSTKTSEQKAQAYREEVGDDYFVVQAELRRLGGFKTSPSPSASSSPKDQEMARDLQSVFCKGRYRTWKPV